MTNTISFRDMVKRIHPDLNPTIKDASDKMTTVVRHKSNPAFLYNLAVKWGLLSGTPNPEAEKLYRWVWKTFYNESATIGCDVYVHTKGIRVTVERITAKRVYFSLYGRRTFCKKENATVIRKVKVEVK